MESEELLPEASAFATHTAVCVTKQSMSRARRALNWIKPGQHHPAALSFLTPSAKSLGRNKGIHMANDPFFWIVVVAVLIVLGILMLGIGSFGKGGDFNRKYANKIMRWRIGAQFVAVLLILLYVYLRRQGG